MIMMILVNILPKKQNQKQEKSQLLSQKSK